MITREAADLRFAQELHEAIEVAIRRGRPDVARRAVRQPLENSDAMTERIGVAKSWRRDLMAGRPRGAMRTARSAAPVPRAGVFA